jgi:two-component system LytT family response regulator
MDNTITCVTIEDEPVARDIIRNYCEQLSFLRIVGEFGNALEAKDFLLQQGVDLLFLDIHMPVLSGISFLKTLKNPPQVIFTTAYHEYAVNAFDLAACDYLLKPFSLERFIVAVDKAREKIQYRPQIDQQDSGEILFIKAEGKIYTINCQDCLFAEAQGNYTKIVTSNRVILTKMTFSAFISLLPSALFCQVHRSYIVNKKRISHIEGNRVFIQQKEIPMAGNYKESFFKNIDIH